MRVLLAWSSGKDSAWALHRLRHEGVGVVALLTTLDAEAGRVGMHGVPRELVEWQAQAVGLPLAAVSLPWPCSNAEYERAVLDALQEARETLRVTHVAFGDLFLEDVRAYRERLLKGTVLKPLFPLWGEGTAALAREMIEGGLRATLTCIDPRVLPASFVGRELDAALLAELPEGVDPCGERGEFHTFAWAGPMFGDAQPITVVGVTERDGFVFAAIDR
jgi:uncharacterized protein (TIGR00290 family)